MAILAHEHHHWAYNWIPVFTAFIWFCKLYIYVIRGALSNQYPAVLLSMLLTWVGTGTPHYVSMDGNIPYISDIGADFLKPWFVVACCITGMTYV
jgi:hypothetical protein